MPFTDQSLSQENTTKDQYFICQVNAYDGTATNSSNSTFLKILNTMPTQGIPIINTSYGNNATNETLYCYNTTQSDADSDAITTSYVWYNNTIKTSIIRNFVDALNTTKTQNWTCEVSVTDGSLTNATNSTTLMILNSRPFINATVPNIAGTAGVAWSYDAINCTDVDDDAITYGVNDSRITVDSNGVLTDTPAESDAGVHTVNASCTDGTINNASQTFTYTVTEATSPAIVIGVIN